MFGAFDESFCPPANIPQPTSHAAGNNAVAATAPTTNRKIPRAPASQWCTTDRELLWWG